MPKIIFDGKHLDSNEGESVLDTLIRNDIDVPYSCKAGVCQTCMMRCTSESIPPASQQELKPNLQKQGYFLSCKCNPENDMHVELTDSNKLYVSAELISKQQLSPTVFCLRLQTATPLYYHAGQFINIKRTDGIIRSYSLASLPSEDNFLELHIKRMENGVMSNWLADEFEVGDSIKIEGPIGDCFYCSESSEQPILLVASGTGLAPLIGIVRDALHNKHDGPIYLYHGAYNNEELYLDKELKILTAKHGNVHYKSCITGAIPEETVLKGRACDIALSDHPKLNGWQIYICGAPSMVKFMQQRVYMAGASLQNIHTDPFETKDLRKESRDNTPK